MIPDFLILLVYGEIAYAARAFNVLKAHVKQNGGSLVCIMPVGDTNSIIIDGNNFKVISRIGGVDRLEIIHPEEIPKRFIPVEV